MLCRSAMLVLLLLLTTLSRSPLVPAQAPARLDAAAATLRPEDIGQPGWVHLGAFVQTLDAVAADVADYRGGSLTPEMVTEQLRAVGWQQSYIAVLGEPSATDPTAPSQIVRSYITEYADAARATAGFAFLEDESMVPSATDVPLNDPLGDEAEATRERGSGAGGPYRSLDITFRMGSVVAGVTVVNTRTRAFTDPHLSATTRLAALLATRVTTAPAPGTTLGGMVLRLGDEEHTITTYDDAYYRIAGEDVPVVEETASVAVARRATYAGAPDVYQLWQGVDIAEERGALVGITLLRFPTADEASTWVRDLQQILGENPFYGELTAVAAPTLGDQAMALTYVPGGGVSGGPQARLVAVRLGADVARVHLVPQGQLTNLGPEVIEVLVRAQVDCLQERMCPVTVPVPSELTSALAESPATPVAASPVAQ
jgi:hypothetical protein